MKMEEENGRVSHPVRQFRISEENMDVLKKLKMDFNAKTWNHFFYLVVKTLDVGNDKRKVLQSLSYENKDRWEIIGQKDMCNVCGEKDKKLDRHHFLGYEGENMFKVKMLCKSCHGKEIHL